MEPRSDDVLTDTWSPDGGPEPGTPQLPERWRPLRRLGRGGQAEVWLVEDLEVGELVAFKLLPPSTAPAVRIGSAARCGWDGAYTTRPWFGSSTCTRWGTASGWRWSTSRAEAWQAA